MPPAPYLHSTVVPEVKSHGFNFADVWEVAVDTGAVQTDENAQFVGGPVRIWGERVGGELDGELCTQTRAGLGVLERQGLGFLGPCPALSMLESPFLSGPPPWVS